MIPKQHKKQCQIMINGKNIMKSITSTRKNMNPQIGKHMICIFKFYLFLFLNQLK